MVRKHHNYYFDQKSWK